jgi:hypothetical protein
MTRIVVCVLLLCACVRCAEKANGEPAPVIRPQPSERCGEACDRMAALGCDEAKPVEDVDGGLTSCAEFCKYLTANGVAWNLDCLVLVSTCDEIELKCNRAQ